MREFDKTIRLAMPFVLLLIGIFVIAMKLSGPPTGTSLLPNSITGGAAGTGNSKGNWVEASWDSQVNLVRTGQSDRIEISQELVGDQHLLKLNGLTGLRELIIEKGKVTDAGVAPLTALPNLEHLRLRGSRIKDTGFKQLCSIASLKQLNLPQADLTDEALASVANLRHLQLLRLSSPRVTDAGMPWIARVATLRWLHLIDVPVTDVSIKTFGEMRALESLYLDGAKVSNKGYEQLFRIRPDLHVHVDQLHHDHDPKKSDHVH